MVDISDNNERIDTSEGEHNSINLVSRLEKNILDLEEEMASMCDLARLSLSLNTPFGGNANSVSTTSQTTLPPPTIVSQAPPNPTPIPPLPNAFPSSTLLNVQIPDYHYQPNIPEPFMYPQNPSNNPKIPLKPVANTSYTHAHGNHTHNPIYVETAPFVHNLHESKSSEKDMLIKSMSEKLDKLASRVQHVESSNKVGGLNYEDLCINPDVELPDQGYKLPKFELFNGLGDPKAHLRMYCDKLVGVGRDEKIRMKLFMRSLTREALSWYIEQDPESGPSGWTWRQTS